MSLGGSYLDKIDHVGLIANPHVGLAARRSRRSTICLVGQIDTWYAYERHISLKKWGLWKVSGCSLLGFSEKNKWKDKFKLR